MWARLGRFLEIYGPKFLDFQRKSDFHWKSSDYETRLIRATEVDVMIRVARFFVQTYQNVKNIPNEKGQTVPNRHKLYQMVVNYSKWP
jgi:hypothetical protein